MYAFVKALFIYFSFRIGVPAKTDWAYNLPTLQKFQSEKRNHPIITVLCASDRYHNQKMEECM